MQHPAGRSKAQRAVLDAIGCGETCPPMTARTREALLRKGLIEKAGERRLKDSLGSYSIPIYQMPISVHYAWCAFHAAEHDKDPNHDRS